MKYLETGISHRLLLIVIALMLLPSIGGSEEQRIRPGHTLKIIVTGHPEFSQSVEVRQDGTIEYPLLVGIPIDGLTPAEVRNLLIPVLVKFITEPTVYIILSETHSINFQVQGAVRLPGDYRSKGRINIHQALAIAGGMLEESDDRSVYILREEGDNRRELTVDLWELYNADTLGIAPVIKDEDIIIVRFQQDEDLVRIFGNVNQPGSYLPQPGWNLADALLIAGGISEDGDGNRVVLIPFKSQGKRNRIKYRKMIMDGKYYELPKVMPGDMIIVPSRPFWSNVDYWVSMLQRVYTVLTAYLLIRRL